MKTRTRIEALEKRLAAMQPSDPPVTILPLDFPGITPEQRQTAVDFLASGQKARYGIRA
jgi:hypothetical protein